MRFFSDETRKKISEAGKGNKHNLGKKYPGRILSEDHKNKLRISRLGIKLSEEHKRKISIYMKGRKRSPMADEWKEKISKALKGKPKPWKKGRKLSKEHCKKLSEAHKGKKWSRKARIKASKSHRGNKCNFWKGGITAINDKIRGSIEIHFWREAVFARDSFTCHICKIVGGELNAHHIKKWSKFKKLRYKIDNGITLCVKCHKSIHKKYGK